MPVVRFVSLEKTPCCTYLSSVTFPALLGSRLPSFFPVGAGCFISKDDRVVVDCLLSYRLSVWEKHSCYQVYSPHDDLGHIDCLRAVLVAHVRSSYMNKNMRWVSDKLFLSPAHDATITWQSSTKCIVQIVVDWLHWFGNKWHWTDTSVTSKLRSHWWFMPFMVPWFWFHLSNGS